MCPGRTSTRCSRHKWSGGGGGGGGGRGPSFTVTDGPGGGGPFIPETDGPGRPLTRGTVSSMTGQTDVRFEISAPTLPTEHRGVARGGGLRGLEHPPLSSAIVGGAI